jgi:TATA-box binding protein (TBP) (component of TFIID and TFIIIB)
MNSMPNNMNGFFQRLNQLKQTFKGDPRQQIQNMLNSGQVTQEEYNRAVQMAQNIQKMMH